MENRYPGLFIIIAVCNPGVKGEIVKKEILKELKKIKEGKVTKKELKKIKTNTKADFIYSLESSSSVANLYGSYLARGDIKPLLDYEKNINALTLETIKSVANKYFDTKNLTSIILKDEK